jgi:hypothetical protein
MPLDPFAGDEDPYAAEEQVLANELSGDGVSVSSIVTTPESVGPTQDPLVAQDLENGESQQPSASQIDQAPTPTNYGATLKTFDDGSSIQTFDDGSTLITDAAGKITSTSAPVNAVDPATANATNTADTANGTGIAGAPLDTTQSAIKGLVQQAQQQQTISSQRKQTNNGDWRVRLSLAPQAQYLYNARQPGILQPLQATNGVVFPYTPSISTAYRANYSAYDLTHSNYRGYFYQNSYIDVVNLVCTFTAQDTTEANYLLAVIHFFRSVTKMFYGQDAERGSPPPLVYLSGLGQYQFNEHPCLIQQFNYTLPTDVDYIRAQSVTNTGQDLTTRRNRPNGYSGTISPSVNRLITSFLTPGAVPNPPAQNTSNTLINGQPTYVPTKMDISLTLLPVQSRQQVSQQFSVKEFANGNLLRGGFW